MKIEQFTELFADDIVMVDLEVINTSTVLDELEDWDSMAVVALNAILDEHYSFTLNEDELKELTTFGDIIKFIELKSVK